MADISDSIAMLPDDDLLETRDILEAKKANLYEQKMAWEAGDLIGYDREWSGRLRGTIAHTRDELQAVKTELRRRGLMSPPSPQLPSVDSRKWLVAKREALEAAMSEMLPADDVAAIKGLADNIYQEWRDTADRNRETNGDDGKESP